MENCIGGAVHCGDAREKPPAKLCKSNLLPVSLTRILSLDAVEREFEFLQFPKIRSCFHFQFL